MSNRIRTLAVAAVAGLAAPAMAQDVLSFGFNNLSGSFSNGTFTAVASATQQLSSAGDVTRLVPVINTATFAPGTVNFSISISVTANNGTTAAGSGSFTITGANGATISGNVSGDWLNGAVIGGNQTFFNGDISNVTFGGGSLFTGSSGSLSTDFGNTILVGAIQNLFIQVPAGNFFTSSFSAAPTQVQGQLTPTPGAAALLGLGGFVALRRRR